MQLIRKVIDNHSQLAYIISMIHCVCNNINTAALKAAAKAGAETPSCVMRACGTKFNCGQCKTDIAQKLAELCKDAHLLEAAE